MIGKKKVDMFRWLEDKINGKISEWTALLLSSSGKEILIKACLQTYPLYAMNCFRFPNFLCDKLSKLVIKFWWESDMKHRGIHWVRKDILQKEKRLGGMFQIN